MLRRDFDDRGARIEAVRRAAGRRCDTALVEDLVAQHEGLPSSPARLKNLEQLASGKAAVVVSGQQAGLFGGPAFTVYKAAGVLETARQLTEESGIPCVGVFWLQTEDHDWGEIDHCFVQTAAGTTERIRVEDQEEPPRTPVASRVYGPGIETAVAHLRAALADRPRAEETVALLARHYRADQSPGQALRGLLDEVFADQGLLLFDPRRSTPATLVRNVLERSLTDADRLSSVLTEQARRLEEAGLAVQVPVRDGAPLCFVHPDSARGPRYRLEPRGDRWRLCDDGRELATEDVLALAAKDPLHLSTSALLRPVVQDSLFPTAMILAGPGEISYFAQLPPLYEAFGLDMPLVAPRPSFCITAPGDRRRLETLGLTAGDLVGRRDDVLARLLADDGDDPFSPSRVEETLAGELRRQLDALAARALAVDSSLARPFEKARASVDQSIRRLVDKYATSLAHRDQVLVERLDRLRAALAPDGVAQERCYGLASLAAEHGVRALIQEVDRNLQAFDARTIEIALGAPGELAPGSRPEITP